MIRSRETIIAHRGLLLQGRLLMSAFFAGEPHAQFPLRGRDAIFRAALSARSLDPCIALLHGDGFPLHGFFDQPLGFLAHRLFRHFTSALLQQYRGHSGTGSGLHRERVQESLAASPTALAP
jgi:hypothetical protein